MRLRWREREREWTEGTKGKQYERQEEPEVCVGFGVAQRGKGERNVGEHRGAVREVSER